MMQHITLLNDIYRHVTHSLNTYSACLNSVSGILGYLKLREASQVKLDLELDRAKKKMKKITKPEQEAVEQHILTLRKNSLTNLQEDHANCWRVSAG